MECTVVSLVLGASDGMEVMSAWVEARLLYVVVVVVSDRVEDVYVENVVDGT